jgi:hypothetical protein
MNFDVKHNQRVHIYWSKDNPKTPFLKTPTTPKPQEPSRPSASSP